MEAHVGLLFVSCSIRFAKYPKQPSNRTDFERAEEARTRNYGDLEVGRRSNDLNTGTMERPLVELRTTTRSSRAFRRPGDLAGEPPGFAAPPRGGCALIQAGKFQVQEVGQNRRGPETPPAASLLLNRAVGDHGHG